jgi:hypothetical protein
MNLTIGDSVIYVPRHLHIENMNKFDFKHPKCEYGIVSSVNERFIFVRYVINRIPQNTAKATDPEDLFFSFSTIHA